MSLNRRPSLVLAFLGLMSISNSLAWGQAPQARSEKVFVGYVHGSAQKLNYKQYTHLCHAFVTSDEKGQVLPNRQVPNRGFVKEAHDAGVQVLISLGGWGWDKQFAEMVSSEKLEDKYIEAVMNLLQANDYDGFDLDWEYPDTEAEIIGFERLAKKLRKGLDQQGKLKNKPMFLTMAASANPGTIRWLRTDFLVETFDWINVMTYDMAGDWTDYAGHHSPFRASSKVPGKPRSTVAAMEYLTKERGLPPNKLAVGLPLYGRGFAVSEPYASTKGAPRTRIPQGSYANLHRLKTDAGWTRVWDAETQNPWLLAPDRKIVMGYDDAESIALKTEWAMKQGFRGVFFWQVAQDRLSDGSNPLQEAAHAKWKAGQPVAK